MEFRLTIGCSGSGKSTYAKKLVEQGWGEINRDTIRAKLFLNGDETNMWRKYKFSSAKEHLVTEECSNLFDKLVTERKNIICSDTNLSEKSRLFWQNLVSNHPDYSYSEIVIGRELTIDDLLARDNKRLDKPVGRETLISQWERFYTQFGRIYTPNPTLPKAIIVDIDGTICLKSPHRGYYDYDKVTLDSPRELIISLISFLAQQNNHILFLSGRDKICYHDTYKWLCDHLEINHQSFSLHMRENKDKRNDRVIKEELFWELSANYNIHTAIDDRPRVVRLWKDLGILNVIDVSNSYHEF